MSHGRLAWNGAAVKLFRRRRATFERETIRIAQEVLGGEIPVEPMPGLDAIAFDDVQLNLAGLRQHYRDLAPDEADAWLQSALNELLIAEDTPDRTEDVDTLLPGLRARSFVEAHRLTALQRDARHEPLAVRPITDTVLVGLVWDRTHSLLSLPESLLHRWDRSYEEALAIALSNLSSMPVLGWVGTDERIFRLVGGDEYVSARLLTGGLFDRLPFAGDIVVCTPTAGDLFAAAADDPAALIDMFEASLEASGRGRPVSLRPLRYSEGRWSDLRLESGHPAYLAWRRLTRIDWAREADSTRRLLQDLVGTGVFVGSLIIRDEEATGMTDAVSVWSEGVPTLLAAADLVAFPRSDRMTATDHYPERWLVESFPSEEELSRLVNR